jgi:hypothetical protein
MARLYICDGCEEEIVGEPSGSFTLYGEIVEDTMNFCSTCAEEFFTPFLVEAIKKIRAVKEEADDEAGFGTREPPALRHKKLEREFSMDDRRQKAFLLPVAGRCSE